MRHSTDASPRTSCAFHKPRLERVSFLRSLSDSRPSHNAGGHGHVLRAFVHDALLDESSHLAGPIQSRPSALPRYAYSILRIALAYLLSLAFSLVYGYIAADNAKAERLISSSIRCILQLLKFSPARDGFDGRAFPHAAIGIRARSYLAIFTGQVWNMAFSFYSSLKSIPREMREVAQAYRWSWWQRFTQMELPYSAIGLVWNSMMSVAGGWFFLMACEMLSATATSASRVSARISRPPQMPATCARSCGASP